MTKTVNNATPAAGDTVTFTLQANNLHSTLAVFDVVIEDQLHDGWTLSSQTGDGTFDGVNGLWTIDEILPGGNATIRLSVVVPDATSVDCVDIVNRATFDGF